MNRLYVLIVAAFLWPTGASAQASDSVTLRIAGTELRTAVQIIQQYLEKPVIFSGAGGGAQVSLETPRPVARSDVPRLLRGLLDSQNYELVDDTASRTYRARPKEVPRPAIVSPQASAIDPARRAASSTELFVLPLRHARAADVATTINALFGRATAGELTLVPDARANSLLIRASRADFDLICAAIEQIDVRPAQVLIEVLIVEARRDRSFALGLGAAMDQIPVAGTSNTTIGGSFAPGAAGLGDFTLKLMGIGEYNLNSTITAAAGRGDVKIVSRPVVLAANDQSAEVVVGSQRPFVQVSRSLPTDVAVRDQVVQYKDVGTKLTVRPTISIDGTVQLSVTQEVSSATSETAFNAPVISTRSVKTDLLVKDGQTIALGGLTDREHDVQAAGVPLLSSIPFIGGLFGRNSRTTTETELFIFLTPRVIRNDDDAKRLSDPLKKRADQVRP